jgi:hypothetical protein
MPEAIQSSSLSPTIVLRSSPPLVHSSTRRSFPSVFARPLWMALILAYPCWLPYPLTQLQQVAGVHSHSPAQGPPKEMLQATICAKTEHTNIRTIASEAIGAGQALSAQVNASQAEKTISKYNGRDEGSNKSSSTASHGQLCCYGCGRPHP